MPCHWDVECHAKLCVLPSKEVASGLLSQGENIGKTLKPQNKDKSHEYYYKLFAAESTNSSKLEVLALLLLVEVTFLQNENLDAKYYNF